MQPAETTEVQQIPLTIAASELPSAAIEARDQLLAAIAAEAQAITARQSGNGAEALEALARAYTLMTGATASVQPIDGSPQVTTRIVGGVVATR